MTRQDEQLEALLDRIPVLQGLPRTVVELAGGLTNQNLRVTTPEHDYVVRVFQGDAELLGIDRDAEHDNTRAAAEAGVGAGVVDYRPDLGVLVIDFLTGTTLENESFADAGRDRAGGGGVPAAARRAAVHRRLRHVPAAGDVPAHGARSSGYRLFDGYADHADAFGRVRRGAGGPRRGPPCRATTTCWPATSSTTATRCG